MAFEDEPVDQAMLETELDDLALRRGIQMLHSAS
jgi:hypothetical protein